MVTDHHRTLIALLTPLSVRHHKRRAVDTLDQMPGAYGSEGRGFEPCQSPYDLQEVLQLWLFGQFTSCVSLSEWCDWLRGLEAESCV